MRLSNLSFSVNLNGTNIPITLNKWVSKNKHLVNVNVEKLDNAWSRDSANYIGPNGKNGIKDRYQRFGEFSQTAKSIEASEIHVSSNGSIMFSNGRHRFAYMRDNGVSVMPVAMDNESIQNATKYNLLA